MFHHCHYSLQKDLDIQFDIPVFDVFFVQSYDFLKVCDIASAAYLSHTGDAGLNGNSGTVVKFILLKFILQDRSGTHQAHSAVQDIPELWKFIQR